MADQPSSLSIIYCLPFRTFFLIVPETAILRATAFTAANNVREGIFRFRRLFALAGGFVVMLSDLTRSHAPRGVAGDRPAHAPLPLGTTDQPAQSINQLKSVRAFPVTRLGDHVHSFLIKR